MENTYRIDSINKQLVLTFDKNNKLVSDDMKQTVSSSSRYNPILKVWIIPVDEWSKGRIFQFLKKWNFKHRPIPQSVYEKYDYSITNDKTEELKKVFEEKGFQYTPRQYQFEALDFALKRGNIFNADDMGLGKTMEAIMYAEYTNSFPCLVIVPASVKYNWLKKWIEIVGPHRTVSAIESAETKKRPRNWDADIIIINYDIIGKKQGKGATANFKELLTIPWKMFICDEAHFLKEKTSQRSRAFKLITKNSTSPIQFLSGTATLSRPAELWNLLVLLKVDHLVANEWETYIQMYCNGHQDKYGWICNGATNLLELNRLLRDICYLRREKREVLTELPPVTKIILDLPITNKKLIDEAENDFLTYMYEHKGEEAAEKALGAETLVKIGVLRKLAMEGKLKAIEQFLNDWKPGGEKLVIFGVHREPLEYLSAKYKSKVLLGGITAIRKQEIIEEWIASDEPFLFANIKSAGTGTDGLQEVCSNELVIELPWNISELDQVMARIDRSGQTVPTTVRIAISQETIDKHMIKMLGEKEIMTSGANQGIDIISEESGIKMVMKMLIEENKKKDEK